MSLNEEENQHILKESLGGGTIKSDNLSVKTVLGSELNEVSDPEKLSASELTGCNEQNSVSSSNINNSNADEFKIVIVNREEIKFSFGRNMIINYGKEFLCVLALILTTCATFQNM